MHFAQVVEQNYSYASRATEMGRGLKTQKLSDAPEWVPGAGAYEVKSDFNKLEGTRMVADVDENGEAVQAVVTYTPWDQKGHLFGQGIRTEKKDPQYPGPGQYERDTTFKTKKRPLEKEGTKYKDQAKPSKEEGLGPGYYIVKETSMAAQYSFGVKMGGDPKDSKLMVPRHLSTAKAGKPGPGAHQHGTSIKANNRCLGSEQDSTWQRAKPDFIALPKMNPGPGNYDHENLERKNENKRNPKHSCRESTFPQAGTAEKVNANPGPGQYHPEPIKSKNQKSMLGGKLGESVDYQNCVPGPGTYEPDPCYPIPSFVIKDAKTHSNGLAADNQNRVGAWTYSPKHNFEFSKNMRGIHINGSARADNSNDMKNSQPGPNVYHILGDFDFRDPSKSDQRVGKLAKFAFGMKHNTKPRNLDCPGPGEYETDQYPMWQKNIAYWIGTDVRRDLSVPYSHLYPGSGHYENHQINATGPCISFPRTEKDTKIEKTYAPGPGSYHSHGTVGAIQGYNRDDKKPRIVEEVPKKERM